MNSNKINILFLIASNRVNKSGECSLKCRLTYLKKRKEFSTGLFINPNHWNSKKQKVLAEAENYEFTNTQLSLIKSKINQAFLMLQIQAADFSVNDIFTLYKGEKLAREYNVIKYFEGYLKRLVGVDLKQITWNKSYSNKIHFKKLIYNMVIQNYIDEFYFNTLPVILQEVTRCYFNLFFH